MKTTSFLNRLFGKRLDSTVSPPLFLWCVDEKSDQKGFYAGTAGSFLRRIQIYSQDASILGWTCGNLIAPAGSAAVPWVEYVSWVTVTVGCLAKTHIFTTLPSNIPLKSAIQMVSLQKIYYIYLGGGPFGR